MRAVEKRLRYLVQKVPVLINNFSQIELSTRPATNKWSKAEILGHLCDSAINNINRFVRIQFEPQPYILTPYDQNNWVSVQRYQNQSIDELLEYWLSLNKHIIHVIASIPQDKYNYEVNLGAEKTFSFTWLIQDYLDHMEHHLKQIFNVQI